MDSHFLEPIKSNKEWKLIDPESEIALGKATCLDDENLRITMEWISKLEDLLAHERSAEVRAAMHYLMRKYRYHELHMEQNRQRAFVIGLNAERNNHSFTSRAPHHYRHAINEPSHNKLIFFDFIDKPEY